MKIGTIEEGLVRVGADSGLELLDLPERDLSSLVASGPEWRERVSAAGVVGRLAVEEAVGASILGPEASVWGIGLNYASKAIATGRTPGAHPVIFLRSATTGARPAAPVSLPGASQQVDFEGELAVLVGTSAYQIDAARAWSHIAAITPANDLTARDVMRKSGSPAIAKSFPGFGPLGWLAATPDTYADPDDLELLTKVNGIARQHDRTSGMLLSVPEVVALVAAHAVLRPGDVVLTGSPAGAGDENGVYLQAGDVVEVFLADLPPLTTTIAAHSKPDPSPTQECR